MGIEFNLDFTSGWERFLAFGSQDPVTIAIKLFLGGGWVVFLILMLMVIYDVWLDGRRGQYMRKWKHVLLAVDIPKNNEQTPKAVENIFAALEGTQSGGNLIEKFWEGKVQESFSFELVSMEGYIQFLIRTPSHFRDLVEAAVYAQYPDAEITEVEDYAQDYSKIHFPNDKYNLWGTEFVLVKDYPYPIRTYPEFEHMLSQSFIDPMGSLLEIMSRFGQGEQTWLQLVVTPMPPGWGEKAKKVVKELTGQPYVAPETWADKIINKPMGFVASGVGMLASMLSAPGEEPKKKEEDKMRMMNLSPGDRAVLESIQKKTAKHPFRVKFRLVYFGEKAVFHKGRGVAAIIGAIQQFNTNNANGFKPGKRTKTGADYFRVKKRVAARQNKIMRHYVQRNNYYGDSVDNMLLNNEELASLWHFPAMTVKAPSVEMIVSKKVVPPTRLPIGDRDFITAKAVQPMPERPAYRPRVSAAPPPVELPTAVKEGAPESVGIRKPPTPPSNLPTV